MATSILYKVIEVKETKVDSDYKNHCLLNKTIRLKKNVAGCQLEGDIYEHGSLNPFTTATKVVKVSSEKRGAYSVLVIETWDEKLYLVMDRVLKYMPNKNKK